jgi:hypothetical protein
VNEETNEERTAVAEETEGQSKQTESEESGAAQKEDEDALAKLLAEYDEQEKQVREPKSDYEPNRNKDDDLDVDALAKLEARIKDQEARDRQRELDTLLSRLTEGVEADEIDAEGFLIAASKRNPEVEKFYLERHERPKRWRDTEKALRADFEKRYGRKIDKDVTENKSALASAVRSASTAAPDQDNYNAQEVGNMTKDEFDNLQRKLGITPV